MLATRLVALLPTVTLAVVFEASNTFDKVAQTLNVVQSLVLPFALVPCVHVAADRKLLGQFASHPALTWFAALVVAVVAAINGWTVTGFVRDTMGHSQASAARVSLGAGVVVCGARFAGRLRLRPSAGAEQMRRGAASGGELGVTRSARFVAAARRASWRAWRCS